MKPSQVIVPAVLYACGLAVSAIFASTLVDSWLPLLFLSGMAAAFVTWRQVPWPDDYSRYLSFGAVLLLMCVVNRLFYIADYLMAGARFDEWPFYVSSPELAVFKGEILTVTGILITVFAWLAAGGLAVRPAAILDGLERRKGTLLALYCMSLIGLILSARRPLLAASLGQLLPTLLASGIVSAYLLPLAMFRLRVLRLAGVALLTVPYVVAALGAGMKENIILALLPLTALTWTYLRHPVLRAGLLAIGVVGLAVITSYVEQFREQIWRPQAQATETEVLEDFVGALKSGEAATILSKGWTGFVGRSNAAFPHGWAVSIADEEEFQPALVFEPLTYVFVPRILWPEKPEIRQGWEYSGLVFGDSFMNWSDSSTAAGFYTSLYLGYGWLSWAAGAVLMGVLLAVLSRAAMRLGGPFAAGIYVFSMLPFMLRLDEAWSAGALSGPIISLVYVLAIVVLARGLQLFMPRGRLAGPAVR